MGLAADTNQALASESGAEPRQSLRAVLVRSFGWTTAARVTAAIGVVVRYILFARLLKPFDFGVVGAANFCQSLFIVLTNPNFDPALTAQPEEVTPYLDTVWVTMIAQGALIGAILFVAARPLSSFFQIEQSYRVFWAIAISSLLVAAKSPASTCRIYRSLDFRISFMLNVAEQIAAFVFGLTAILYWRDWRGLIVAIYAGDFARLALTFWYFPYRPRLRFELARAKKMFDYGRWVTLRGMAEFAAQRLDSLAVGHLVGAKALGEYQMAFRLGEMPATEVANSARIISFSMVSRPRFASHRERLFAFFMGIVALVGIAYVLFIAKWGSWLIVTAVGAKWLGSVRPLKWLCLYGLGRGLMSIGTGFLDGLGVPDSSFRVTLFGAVVLAVLVYPLTLWFGTVGAAAAVVTSVAVALPLMLKMYWDAGSQLKPAGAE